jgi:hypothetical protein
VEETEADLAELQRVLDASATASGAHLQTAFSQQSRPSAADLIADLQGIFELHFAVVTSDGAPLVAPLDGIFYRGRVWVGLPVASVRARLLRGDNRVSASYISDTVSFIVHGTFREVPLGRAERTGFDVLARRLYVERYGDWFNAWLDDRLQAEGPGPTGYIKPRRMYAKR